MLPVQPFYYSVTQFPLHIAVSAQQPWMVSYFIAVSTNPAYRFHHRLMHVRFKAKSPISVLGGRAAAVSFNGRTYHDLLLTTVSMSPVLNGPPAMDSILRIDIPADLILIAEEVVKLPARELLCYLDETSSFVYRREYTQALVRDHFAGSQHDSAQRLQVSLICPLSQKIMEVPCRGMSCRHLQCFDAYAYLGCNEDTLAPSWRCPVCSSQILMQDIRVDFLTLHALREADYLFVTMVFKSDASWELVVSDDDQNTWDYDQSMSDDYHNTSDDDQNTSYNDQNPWDYDQNMSDDDHTTSDDDHSTLDDDHSTSDDDHNTSYNDQYTLDYDKNMSDDDHSTSDDFHNTSDNDQNASYNDQNTSDYDQNMSDDDHYTSDDDQNTSDDFHNTSDDDESISGAGDCTS